MRLYYIRHGQSVNNALWEETGADSGRSEDPELTNIGHKQAQRLGEYIARIDIEARENKDPDRPRRDYFGFTHLYTSLMIRSAATATHISDAIGLRVTAWPEIHECGGIFLEDEGTGELTGLPGKPRSYFRKNFPNLVLPETLTEDGWWNRPFECDEDRPLRAKRVLEMLLERHGGTDDRVAIVSHGGFYNELARVMFNISSTSGWFLMYNTAVSCFEFNAQGRVVLLSHNRTDHLPEELLT